MAPNPRSFPRRLALGGASTVAIAATAVALATLAAPAVAAKADRPDAAAAKALGWVDAGAGKHNGSGIRMRYLVSPATVQPGQAATVKLQFSGVTGDDAKVQWRGPAGATVSGSQGAAAAGSAALPRGQVTTLTFSVVAAADGMATLDVFTSQLGRASAQSVPIAVGSGQVQLKREGRVQTMPNGEKVISLPSQP